MPEDILYCPDLAQALKARLISFQENPGSLTSVSIDSRTLLPGALFVALKGTVQDGHRFVQSAFEAGAAAAMITRSAWENPDLGLEEIARRLHRILLVVENTLKGLQKAAEYYLEQFPRLLKIGITGSSGKTTVKEIAAAMIGQEKKVIANQGNLNSETGLPLSVFQVRPYHEVGIFELGMNRQGEIEEIAGVLKPHIALITHIGSAHIEFFGTKQRIAEEKKAVFSHFSGNERAFIPLDEPYRDFLAAGVQGQVLFYGSQGEAQNQGVQGFEISWDGETAHFGLPGTHNLRNALAAAAIAQAVPVSSQAIRAGLESMKPLFGRSEILQGPVRVIRDCYNANPESMMAAIEMCDAFQNPGRRIYVIGAMLELGDRSPEAHRLVVQRLASSQAALVCLYGEALKAAADTVNPQGRVSFFHTTIMEELKTYLADFIRSGDLVLLKGSRQCALEQLTDTLLSPKKGGV